MKTIAIGSRRCFGIDKSSGRKNISRFRWDLNARLMAMLLPALLLVIAPPASAAWLNNEWRYRNPVAINSATPLANYQVKVEIQGNDPSATGYVDFNLIAPGGQDIRFTDSDETTLLNYWIEAWDNEARTATLWAKVPGIRAGTPQNIYMYYGSDRRFLISEVGVTGVPARYSHHNKMGRDELGNIYYIVVDAFHNDSNYRRLLLAKSTDNGVTWAMNPITYGANQTELVATPWRARPALGVSGPNIFVVYGADAELGFPIPDGWTYAGAHAETMFIKSTDRGATWSEPVALITLPAATTMQDIFVSGTDIFVITSNGPGAHWDIVYVKFRHSPDGGVTWGPVKEIEAIDNPTRNLWPHSPNIYYDRDSGTLFAYYIPFDTVHHAIKGTGRISVRFAKSIDRGDTWDITEVDSRYSLSSRYKRYRESMGNMVNDGDFIGLIYYGSEGREEILKLFYAESTDGGATWSEPTVISEATKEAWLPSAAIDHKGNVHVIWGALGVGQGLVKNNFVHRWLDRTTNTWSDIRVLGFLAGPYPGRVYYRVPRHGHRPHVLPDNTLEFVWAEADFLRYFRFNPYESHIAGDKTSDGWATFDFFDDFKGARLRCGRRFGPTWDITHTNNSDLNMVNGNAVEWHFPDDRGARDWLFTIKSFPIPVVIESKIKVVFPDPGEGPPATIYEFLKGFSDDMATLDIDMTCQAAAARGFEGFSGDMTTLDIDVGMGVRFDRGPEGSTWINELVGVAKNNYNINNQWLIWRLTSTPHNSAAQWGEDTSLGGEATGISGRHLKLAGRKLGRAKGASIHIDWIRARQYAPVEPSTEVLAKEALGEQ